MIKNSDKPSTSGMAGGGFHFHMEAFDEKTMKWSRWVSRFETALDIFDVVSAKKIQYLLHYMGTVAYDRLCDKALPATPEQLTYTQITSILENHYNPAPNEILVNFRFHSRKQKVGETAAEFLVALRHLAVGCNFGDYNDKALRNQFVYGLSDQKVQSRLLEKSDLKLEDAANIVSAYEIAEKGFNEIASIKKENDEFVDKVQERSKVRNSPHQPADGKCFRCGSTDHMANRCKHMYTVCNYCKRKGHLRKVCFKAKKMLGMIVDQEDDTASNVSVEDLLHVENFTHQSSVRDKIMCKLLVNNRYVMFEVDTGAPVTIMCVADARKYLGGNMNIHSPDLKLYSYCKTPIDCLGYVWATVRTSKASKAKVYLVQSDRKPLLGREWLRTIQLDWSKMLKDKFKSHAVVNHIQQSIQREGELKEILEKFPTLFSTTSGKIIGFQARLQVKADTFPRSLKARRVPFPLLQAVERELEDQVRDGLLVKVDRSEWATPVVVVRKSNNKVRLCGDYKVTVNPNLLVDEHPLPTIEELFSTMAGGDKFSKIDLAKAYLQLEVNQEDQHLLTLSTHKGLYRPTRLMYGIACAPSIWQRFMEQLLADIPGVKVFLDDIKITASNDKLHLERLEEVLRRLDKHNMRINLEKSQFLRDSIEYCGYIIDRTGIRKMESKMEAIRNMKKPSSKEEVRSFLGLVNYYGRFIRNLSSIVYPLNRLLHKDVRFNFDAKCEAAFHQIKEQINSDTVLTHYDPKLPVTLAVDASPTGVGAVLSHEFNNGVERPIQFASRTLNETQQRYSQVDREAFAIIFGVQKFYQYVYGRKFTLITDNKAISQIFSPNKGLPVLSATRMQHYAVYLESFDYEIRFRNSKENCNADALSRLPTSKSTKTIAEIDQVETEIIENLPVTVKGLSAEIKRDKEVKHLIECLKYGRKCENEYRFGIEQDEFALQQGCLLRGLRVYIPHTLRLRVLEELHTGHFGMAKMKSLARAYCWWKALDQDIERLVMNCRECQSSRPNPSAEPVHVWLPPKKIFERVHVDYAGPFLGKYFFVLVDAYSKWPEVRIVPNITAETTIKVCRNIFATFGIPNILVSDHGTQFKSGEFKKFLDQNGVVHKLGAPYHPATNGQAERFIQTFKNKLYITNHNRNELQKDLDQILVSYRRAIHPATGKSPAMIMFNRQIQSRLDLILPCNTVKDPERQMTSKMFKVGEKVAVREYIGKEKWKFGTIKEKRGDLHHTIVLEDGRIWRRHVDQMRRVGSELAEQDIGQNEYDPSRDVAASAAPCNYEPSRDDAVNTEEQFKTPPMSPKNTDKSPKDIDNSSNAVHHPPLEDVIQEAATEGRSRRPVRDRKVPKHLVDYELEP